MRKITEIIEEYDQNGKVVKKTTKETMDDPCLTDGGHISVPVIPLEPTIPDSYPWWGIYPPYRGTGRGYYTTDHIEITCKG